MKHSTRCGIFAASLIAFGSAAAQEADALKFTPPGKITILGAPSNPNAEEANNTSKSLQELYSGFVTDQTITVAGQDFYQAFTFFWREKQQNERYTLSVHERPSARLGNQIWVEHSGQRIFQAVLPPSRPAIRPIADQAAAIAYENVIDMEIQRSLFKDPDLAVDEF